MSTERTLYLRMPGSAAAAEIRALITGGWKIMTDNDSSLYAAFKAKDARFDGRFFVGISTTGIYCRPVCRAKQPKPGNCTFFRTAAEAEKAGYRPCLLCRPELAPGCLKETVEAD